MFDSHFKYLVFKNPSWNYLTLNFDADIALADRLDKNTINATDPNLKRFVARGREAPLVSRLGRRVHRAAQHGHLL